MDWIKRNELAVFLLLAFALSWWPWPFSLLNPESTPMIPWGPIVAALIVLALTRGRVGVRALLSQMFHWRVGAAWYALAFTLPVAVTLAAVYLNVAMGAPAPDPSLFGSDQWLLLIPQLFITTLLAGPFTEEPAWRGFFLPRLQSKLSPWAASLIIGVVWWSWHLPLMLSDETGQRPVLPFLVMTLALSFLFTWIYNNTNASLLLIAIFHGVINTLAAHLFPSQFGEAYLRLWWVYNLLWLIAIATVLVATKTSINQNSKSVARFNPEVEKPNL